MSCCCQRCIEIEMSNYPSIDSLEGSAQRNLPSLISVLREHVYPIPSKRESDLLKTEEEKDSSVKENEHSVILELASGSGEHAIGYVEAFGDRWRILPSERDSERVAKIRETIAETASATGVPTANNPKSSKSQSPLDPVQLDIRKHESWSALKDFSISGVIITNLLHCSPPDTLKLVAERLAENHSETRWISIYGAFLNDDGSCASEGDRKFDERFRSLDSQFGLRSVPNVLAEVRPFGWNLVKRIPMPQGNWWLLLERGFNEANAS